MSILAPATTQINTNRNSLKSHHINSLNIYHPRYKVPKPKLFLSQELHHSSYIYSVCSLQSVAAWSVNSSKAWGPDPSHQMPPFRRQGSNPRRTPYNVHMHHHLISLFITVINQRTPVDQSNEIPHPRGPVGPVSTCAFEYPKPELDKDDSSAWNRECPPFTVLTYNNAWASLWGHSYSHARNSQ